MTKTSNQINQTVSIISENQSMFGTGAAPQFGFSEYIPIIGGDITDLSISRPVALDGTATVQGDTVVWDDEGLFDGLAPGQVATTSVTWDVLDADGNRVSQSGMNIEVRGTSNGPVFNNTETGDVSTNGLTSVAYSAKDMLQDAHTFEKFSLIHEKIDLGELVDVDLGDAAENAADIVNLAKLAGEVLTLEGKADTARFAADQAKKLQAKIDAFDPEGRVSDFLQDGVNGGIDLAQDAVSMFEDAINGAAQFFENLGEGALEFGKGILEGFGVDFEPTAEEFVSNYMARQKQLDLFDQFNLPDSLATTIMRSVHLAEKPAFLDALKEIREDSSNDKLVDFANAQLFLDQLGDEANEKIEEVENLTREYRTKFFDQSVEELEEIADDAEADLASAKAEVVTQLEELQDRGLLTDLPITVKNVDFLGFTQSVKSVSSDVIESLASLLIGAVRELDAATLNLQDQIDANAEIKVDAEGFVQAGLMVDFQISGGSVNSALDYDLTSTATLDTDADTFTVTAQVADADTGQATGFDTLSPNMSFFAGIAYSAGATFDVMIDLFAEIAGVTVADLGPINVQEDVAFDGIFNLIDFDSTDSEPLEVPLPDAVADILTATIAIPTVETSSTEAAFSVDAYKDAKGLVDLDKVADLIVNLTEQRLDFSPEFKALLAEREGKEPADVTGEDFATAIEIGLGALLDSIGQDGDTDGDGFVPILQMTSSEKGGSALVHLDTIAEDLSGLDIENGGTFGFFVAEGQSDNFVQVDVDVDQLIATAVAIAKTGNAENVVNPLQIEFSTFELLREAGVDKRTAREIKELLEIDLSIEAADLDVRTGANVTQDFALSVDDIDFSLEFEDGTIRTVSANEGGEIVVNNASGLVDVNGNGQIDYTLNLTPSATLFNDTEISLNVGYTLDFLKAKLDLAANLPLDGLISKLGLEEVLSESYSLGPVLRLDGDLDVLSADVFEDIFDFDAGTAGVVGAFDLSLGEEEITISEVPPAAPVLPDVAAPLLLASGPIKGTASADFLTGTDGRDKIKAKGGDDFVEAGGDNDKVIGGSGSDVLLGEDGRDKLKGGKDVDFISGGEGRDVLIGGKGDDHLQGDAGADVFKFAKGQGTDNIIDFEVGVDTIAIGRGANGIEDLDLAQQGSTAVISFADTEILIDSVLVEDLLAADAFSF